MKKNFVLLILGLCLTAFAASCGDDEQVSASVASLNMLNEDNGKTLLDETGIYINSSMNFHSNSWQIVDMGMVCGFPVKQVPNLSNLSNEVGVLSNHQYVCCASERTLTFPSHKNAYEIESKYYQMRVSSFLEKDNHQIGAVVEYMPCFLEEKNLPQNETIIGSLAGLDDHISFDALGAEEYCFFGKAEDFSISLSNGHLDVALRKSPNKLYGPYGKYSIFLRKGNVYTKVIFSVNL